jgi:hypothetical protein
MKYYLLPIILFTLFLSCHKDSIEYEVKEEISAPEVIEYPVYSGKLLSENGEVITDVKIDVFQDDKKMGTIYTDEEGFYSTHEIQIQVDKEVTFRYIKESYSEKYRRYENDKVINIEKELILGPTASEDDGVMPMENPSDTNFIRLYGYVLLKDGTPVSGARCHAVWAYWKLGQNGLWCKASVMDYSDSDGYFELLVPKSKVIHLEIFKSRYPDQYPQCNTWFLAPSGELEKWHYKEVGSFEEDTYIELIDNIEFNTINSHASGKALRCDGQPVHYGSIRFGIIANERFYLATNYVEEYYFGPNGEYDISIETCEIENFDLDSVWILIEDYDVNFQSDRIKKKYEEEVQFEDLKLCIDNNDYPDVFHLELGTSQIIDFEYGGDYGSSDQSSINAGFHRKTTYSNGEIYKISLYLEIDSLDLGELPIKKLKMFYSKSEVGSNIYEVYETAFDLSYPDEVICTISKIEGSYVFGMLKGEVETPQGIKQLTANFEIYNK